MELEWHIAFHPELLYSPLTSPSQPAFLFPPPLPPRSVPQSSQGVFPGGVRGGAPTANAFWRYFEHKKRVSWQRVLLFYAIHNVANEANMYNNVSKFTAPYDAEIILFLRGPP